MASRESDLLALPPELRTLIWEFVAWQPQDLKIRYSRIQLPFHPLSVTCHLTATEFTPIYIAIAPLSATTLSIQCPNLGFTETTSCLSTLTQSEREALTANRSLRLNIHLEDYWPKHYLRWLPWLTSARDVLCPGTTDEAYHFSFFAGARKTRLRYAMFGVNNHIDLDNLDEDGQREHRLLMKAWRRGTKALGDGDEEPLE